MRVGILLFLLLASATGVGIRLNAIKAESPFTGGYEFLPLRTLTLEGPLDLARVAIHLQGWAEGSGYKFRVASPSGEPGSISIDIWKDKVVLVELNILGRPGLEFAAYWNGDTADDRAIDAAVEQLRMKLAPFGPVEVVSAPPETPPRKETKPHRFY